MVRDTLTQEQIVNAAIDLLDSEGLEGLSMRVLGERLGSAATAGYWHIGNKENLIILAGDLVWKEVVLPDLIAVDWRTAATVMASGMYDMLTRHLWLVQAFGSYMIYGPAKARHDDHCLAVFEKAGFTGKQADLATASVFIFVLGNALGPAAAASFERKLRKQGGNAKKLLRERTSKAREIAAQFPHLRERLETSATDYAAAPQNSFEFGLQAILDGIECQLVTDGKPLPTPSAN